MFARIVSLALVVAIVACPMWCGDDRCDAGQCCSSELTAQHSCLAQNSACCCSDENSPENDDHQSPQDTPRKSPCQSVCGGAVFEKPSEVDDFEASFFLTLPETDVSVDTQLANFRSQGVEQCWHCRGGNHGRFLRTLQMSILC